MNKKISHIFTLSGCPDESELLEYVRGNISHDRLHEIESHLSDCEMCSDVVEGLSMMSEPEKFPEVVAELNSTIDAFVQKKTLKKSLTFRTLIAAAAMIIVLVTVTFVLQKQYFKQSVKDIAQNLTVSKQNPSSPEERENVLAPADEGRNGSGVATGKKAPPLITDIAEFEETEYDDAIDVRLPVSVTALESGNVMNKEKTVSGRSDADEIVTYDVTENEVKGLIMEEAYIEDVRLVNSDEISRETKSLSPISTKDSEKKVNPAKAEQAALSSVELNKGIQFYEDKNYQASLTFFENVLKTNPQDREAQWYYALNLIKLKRTEDAIKVLQEIISEGGNYKNQAEQELKKLQE